MCRPISTGEPTSITISNGNTLQISKKQKFLLEFSVRHWRDLGRQMCGWGGLSPPWLRHWYYTRHAIHNPAFPLSYQTEHIYQNKQVIKFYPKISVIWWFNNCSWIVSSIYLIYNNYNNLIYCSVYIFFSFAYSRMFPGIITTSST